MTTYAFPSHIPHETEWGIIANDAVFGDPFKGTVQTLGRSGAKWFVTLSFPLLTGDNRLELMAFLAKLNGREHRFTLHDHSATLQGVGGGTPLVNGASQTGLSLVTDGWSGSNPVLKRGDWFSVNGELKLMTADANHTTGDATLEFTPALRESPANNDPIDISSPTATFMLADSRVSWTNRPGSASRVFSGFTISAIEAFT